MVTVSRLKQHVVIYWDPNLEWNGARPEVQQCVWCCSEVLLCIILAIEYLWVVAAGKSMYYRAWILTLQWKDQKQDLVCLWWAVVFTMPSTVDCCQGYDDWHRNIDSPAKALNDGGKHSQWGEEDVGVNNNKCHVSQSNRKASVSCRRSLFAPSVRVRRRQRGRWYVTLGWLH